MEIQEENKHPEPAPSDYNVTISVLNSNENWLELPDFNMTVSDALNLMLVKLRISRESDDKTKLKYFLLRDSDTAPDGYEILAEYDKYGAPITLADYNISSGNKLNIGAIVLPKGKSDIKLKGDEKITFFNDEEEEIFEL